MAEELYYIDSQANTRTLHSGNYYLKKQRGVWEIGSDPVIEKTPQLDQDIYQASRWKPRKFGFLLGVTGASYSAIQTNWRTLCSWLEGDMGIKAQGEIKRVISNANTRHIKCIPTKTQIMIDSVAYFEAWLWFLAADPFWYNPSQQTASGNYNDAAAVNISCANAGSVEAWPVITITGVVDTPKVQNSDGEYTEIDLDQTHANDVVVIDCRPGYKTITHTPNGGAATNYLGYRSSSSKFFALPTGTNNVTISATTGNATCQVAWYNRYGGLG